MRNLFLLSSILFLFSFARCNKDRLDSNGLPPSTQSGKNTLGFLLNGQPWTPKGSNGTANLSIDVDFGYNNGIFDIAAKRIISPNINESFGIGVRDSLSNMSIPITLPLTNVSLYGARFSSNTCSIDFFETAYRYGSLTITKLDRSNKIVAGTFNAILHISGCDTIRITDGRFDMRY